MINSPQTLVSWKSELDEKGFIYRPNQSEETLNALIEELGEVLFETDVIANKDSKSLVTSDKYLDFHTDNHLAKYIVWYCLQPASQGGISLLCDARKVFERLNKEEKIDLSKIHVYEHKLFPENRNSNPIVRETDGSIKFYYSYWLAREKYRELPVFKKWQKLIREAPYSEIKLSKSDILVIDNHRILHGRTPIEGNRYLKRYWIKEQRV